MKKVFSLLLCIATCAALLSACAGSPQTAQPDPVSPSEGSDAASAPKVMVIAKNLTDPYSTWLLNMCEKFMKESWPEAEYVVFDQQGDPANTESFYDQAVLDHYDLVILQKVSGSQDTDALLQGYADQGIRSIVINNEVSDGVSCSVFFPEYTMGALAASYAAEMLPENAKVCILKSTPSLFSSEERTRAYTDMLAADRPDVEILDTQNCEGWSKDTAINIMSDWCQRFDQIDAVLSANDGMVLGAIEAAKADGRDTQAIQFYGIDGLADGCLSIQAGEETASVLQDATAMAKSAVELAKQLYQNPDMEAVKEELEPVLITPENVEQYIEMHRENGVIR